MFSGFVNNLFQVSAVAAPPALQKLSEKFPGYGACIPNRAEKINLSLGFHTISSCFAFSGFMYTQELSMKLSMKRGKALNFSYRPGESVLF